MDNEIRAAIDLTITLPLDPFDEITTPVVKSVDLGFGQSFTPSSNLYEDNGVSRQSWIVAGQINTDHDLETLRLLLVERGQYIPIDASGRFFISNLHEGEYTLETWVEGEETISHPLLVPSDDYDLDV